MSGLLVRAVVDGDDLARFVAVRNATVPDDPRAVEEEQALVVRHAGRRRLLLAEEDGVVVGVGLASPPSHGLEGGRQGLAGVWVLPAARRRGVGTMLLAAAGDHLGAVGFQAALAWASELRPEGAAFLEHHGFVERSRERRSRRDLTGVLPAGVAPPGIVIGEVSSERELAEIYQADRVVTADIPGPPIDLGDFAQWRATEIDRPARRPPLLLVARADGVLAGFANLHFPLLPDDVAWHAMTGVLPAWRGRGVARALKLDALHRLVRLGCRAAFTSNEERNLAMRRVNERLGYEAMPDEILFERDL